jgi:hypothetical protein
MNVKNYYVKNLVLRVNGELYNIILRKGTMLCQVRKH